MKHVVIVGGGITGLAAAYYLQTHGRGAVSYTLIESAPTCGGKILTAREQGFVVEGGPDSFVTAKPAALELCHALGLRDELIGTNDAARQVYVWSRGRLHPLPDGMMLLIPTKLVPLLKSSLLSWRGKARMGLEVLVPPRRDDGDESLAQFVRRRLGSEALDKIAEPLIAGIYVADAESLSLQSTFPRFLEMERHYGGLLRGIWMQRRAAKRIKDNGKGLPIFARRRPKGDTYGHPHKQLAGETDRRPVHTQFMSLRGGLQQLTDALVARLDASAVWTHRRVVGVMRQEHQYLIALQDGQRIQADAVILATPTYITAALVRDFDPTLAAQLQQIRYVSTATVSLGFRRADMTHPLNGFGFVVPRSEQRKIIACSWSSTKFKLRAPADHILLRVFIGGAHAEALAEQDEAGLLELAREELRVLMGLTAMPVLARVYRWPKANPQYEVGHLTRVAEIQARAAQHPNLSLAGSAYHGVGIPDCIEDGRRAAQKILVAIALGQ